MSEPVNGTPVDAQEAPGFKVFAGNLAYSTTDEGLKTFFAPVSDELLTAQVIQRGTRSAGYGFVALKSAEAAQTAVDLLHKKELDGREVIVEVAKPADQKDKDQRERKSSSKRRPGRRGSKAVPGEVSEAEANGEATTKSTTNNNDNNNEENKKDKSKKKKKSKSAASKAKSEAAATVEGAVASVESAVKPKKAPRKPKVTKPPRPAGEDPVGEPSKSMLFVANLGFSVDDAGLSALFTEAGIHVNSARIVRRRWGTPRRSKGYGFVDVGGEEEQKKAIDLLQGKTVDGREIAVKIAVDTPHAEDEEGAADDKLAGEAEPVATAA